MHALQFDTYGGPDVLRSTLILQTGQLRLLLVLRRRRGRNVVGPRASLNAVELGPSLADRRLSLDDLRLRVGRIQHRQDVSGADLTADGNW